MQSNTAKQSGAGYKIVFCLDGSGSMRGEWQTLKTAYASFIAILAASAPDSKVSVVQFSENATVQLEDASIDVARAFNLVQMGGGTYFEAALQKVHQVLSRGFQGPNLLVFMADGATTGRQDNELLAIKTSFPQLQSHCVFFQTGGGSGKDTMQKIASVLGGDFHLAGAQAALSLDAVFTDIARKAGKDLRAR